MRSSARKTFERLVCVIAVALPVLVLVTAGDAGWTTHGPTLATEAAAATAAATTITTATATTVAAASRPAAEAQAVSAHPSLSYRTSWIGNTWGYADHRWMQIDVQALAVTPDGDVFTNAPWDEGGGELGQYRNGELVRHGGESHGWGMMGGDAIAVNSEYVYVAQTMVSLGNEEAKHRATPREGEVWTGVARRSRADIRDGVPFAGQVKFPAGSRLAYLLISTYSDKTDYAVRGLAADDTRLFVSNLLDNRVQIYDAQTMQPVGAFPVHEPGRLALAPDGSLWVIENSRTDSARRVVHHARDGTRLAELALPDGVVPVDLTVDTRGRLLIADNGVRQQILIFTAAPGATAGSTIEQGAAMQLSASFGQEGGIYAGRAGAPGPRRFNGLTGVGVDRGGNLYVSMNGAGPRPFGTGPSTYDGALLESYTPDGKQRFSLQGLLFVDGAQFVDGEPPSVYSGSKRFTLDLSRPLGQEWSYAGYTADRFRYPYDPYFHLYLGGQRGMPMVRDVRGHRLLYTTDMYSSYLRIYRFADDRETAIPAGLFSQSHIDGAWPPNQPRQGEWIWRDMTGKGDFSPAAFDQNLRGTDAPPMRGWWVDSHGDIWQGTESQGIRCFPLQGFDRVGNPIYRYAAMRQYAPPAPFYRIARLNYFPDQDSMFVSGSTPAHPFVQENWNGAGSQLARYDHWKSGKPVLRYVIGLPDRGAPDWSSISGFAVAGDYVFAVETRGAVVRVYDRASGRDVGRLSPGKEVGSTSGWVDVPMPMTAHRLASGEYLVLVEEDAYGKALMYRFTPQTAPPAAAASHSTTVAQTP
ncbi:NHL repeat family protein [Paraburkholderia xenovorans LB400]|uniref:Exported protein n=1 Tax=Paraburkholderia xenovorans (strain LB400) TaxID=266265 RepID=Q13ZN7_PARXL|nr:hypothetical protein [Paraburkholderia xenovorans]ABE30452.1 Putative exported protein [Paraburkholderia xenovorans LB400]AIP31125.1 NHL repeat family protein [Paraburkholderia xenovorans LB400]